MFFGVNYIHFSIFIILNKLIKDVKRDGTMERTRCWKREKCKRIGRTQKIIWTRKIKVMAKRIVIKCDNKSNRHW